MKLFCSGCVTGWVKKSDRDKRLLRPLAKHPAHAPPDLGPQVLIFVVAVGRQQLCDHASGGLGRRQPRRGLSAPAWRRLPQSGSFQTVR
jgi:hypothetical protein